MSWLRTLLLLTILSPCWLTVAGVTATAPAAEDEKIANRSQVLMVQPIVVRNDQGEEPAAYHLPKSAADERLASSGLEILFLEPITWNQSDVRRGAIAPADIVRQASQQKILRHDQRVVNWIFVAGIESSTAAALRQLEGGRVSLVCLGEARQMTPALLAQLVPDNLSAAAPQRLDRLRFHGGEEARRLLVDESWEPYISAAPLDMIRFSLGLTATTPLPADAAARTPLLAAQYQDKVVEFTDEEREFLSGYVRKLSDLTSADWPAVNRFPWHFIKVQPGFCRGMAHTRGIAIVLSEANLQRIRQDQVGGVKLLLHEKLHVLQRIQAARFAALYRAYGMEPVRLVDGEDLRLNVAQNPDCLQLNWAWRAGPHHYLYLTLLAAQPDGMFRFTSQLRRLQRQEDGRAAIGEVVESTAEFDAWRKTFPTAQGFDHPNEISAYLSSLLLDQDYRSAAKPEQAKPAGDTNERLVATRQEFRRALALVGLE